MMPLDEKQRDHQIDYNPSNTSDISLKTTELKCQPILWNYRKSQWLTKVIRIHPGGPWDVCGKYHGSLSTQLADKPTRADIPIPRIMLLRGEQQLCECKRWHYN